MRRMVIAILFILLFANFSVGNEEKNILIKDDESPISIYPFFNYLKFNQEKIQNKTPHLKVPDIYTPRPPIYINGNENFTEENGVVGGNGTKENPYIIEGWEINASITDGIRIENTTAYFVIRNCYIYKGIENYNYGMVFLNVRNGEVENVILYENGVSIRYSSDFAFVGNNISYGFVVLYEANNCSIIGNEINNLDGIHLINSASISVSNNILNNNYAGIWFYHSSNCIVTQNYLYNNKKGIMLYKSINCTLTNNTMINNGIVLGGDSLKYWNTHEIDVTNTVNGKPVYYWKNIKGGIVPSGAGQVILANCSNVIIKNQNISNATVGIEIGFSNNCNIVNNVVDNNTKGIELRYSDNCRISNNEIKKQITSFYFDLYSFYFSYGIYLYHSKNNIIDNNTIKGNVYGIYPPKSANSIITNNTFNQNLVGIIASNNYYIANNVIKYGLVGIAIEAINCTLTNNTMINNGIVLGGDSLKYWNTHEIDVTNTVNGKPVYYWKNIKGGIVPSGAGQVILANCSNVIIKNQNISNATVGIEIGFSNNCNIVNSILTKSVIGIELHNSTSCIIDECILNNNNISILLLNGKNCKIINSNILYSNITGILTLDSDANNISNCNISHNFQGIEINRASNNYVGYNIFYNNSEALLMESTWYDEIIKNTFCKNTKGISMSWVCFANISRNNFSNNDIAIFIYDSFNNSIFKNEIVSNNYGILIKISTFNKIKYNCICENQIGINMTNTKNNEINYNNIFGNSKYGIKGENCHDNATYNYWGSWFGPSFLFKKPWKGDAIFVYPGWVKIWPWLRFPTNSEIKVKPFIFEFIEFDSKGIYLFGRKFLPNTKIFMIGLH